MKCMGKARHAYKITVGKIEKEETSTDLRDLGTIILKRILKQ
jgi:hypothetical protein